MRIKYRWYICQLELGAHTAAGEGAGDGGGSSGSGGGGGVTATDVFSAVRASVHECFGDVGCAVVQSALAVKHYSPVTNLCLVRGPAGKDADVHAAIALTRVVKRRQAALRVLQVCSSATRLRPAVKALHEALVARMSASASSDAMELDAAFLAALDGELADAMAE